jgi:hypothetical protein
LNVEAESQALKQRSAELAAQLDAAIVTVDRSGINAALAESRRLAGAARAARAEVSKRLADGKAPGVPLGPRGWIRKTQTDLMGRDLDPHLQGRVAVTSELVAYHVHRRDTVAAAIRSAYREAAERFERPPALLSADRGHIGVLRQQGSFLDEDGEELHAALRRFLDSAGVLREGLAEGDRIAEAAEAALERLRTAPVEAQIEAEAGPTALFSAQQWVQSRWSAALDSQPIDAVTGAPIPVGAKPASRRK